MCKCIHVIVQALLLRRRILKKRFDQQPADSELAYEQKVVHSELEDFHKTTLLIEQVSSEVFCLICKDFMHAWFVAIFEWST